MRIAVLANSLPSAIGVYDEVVKVSNADVSILLVPTAAESPAKAAAKHCARLVMKSSRLKSLRLMLKGKVLVFNKPLADADTVRRLQNLDFDIGLHKSGLIYSRAIIDAFSVGILNAHIGILPGYRGRSVMEWSLLEDAPVGITVFFVDEGIDTGVQIVFSEEVDISGFRTITAAKEHLFSLDGAFYRKALERLQNNNVTPAINDGSGRRYYVMSKLFQDVVQKILESQ